MSSASDNVLVSVPDVRAFIKRCFQRVGTSEDHSAAMADVIVAADHRGHFSHGINRLELYINEVKSGLFRLEGEPRILSEKAATAHVDGNNLLGPVVGNFCMQLAIKKAKESGVGWVVAKGSNHYGIAGWYSMQAAEHSLLGMSLTNTAPILIPTRSKQCWFGTNPISVAAPAKNNDSFVLDMATTTVALGKVEMNERKKEPIPNGWGADQQGKETNNPGDVLDGGGLLPLGGAEQTGGYKGYGLAMMVEIFCGILGGATWGPHIRHWKNPKTIADLSHCFVAIDPEAFAPGFADRLQQLLDESRQQDPADENYPVLVAGDPERLHIEKCHSDGGITYHKNLIQSVNELAAKLQVQPLPYETFK